MPSVRSPKEVKNCTCGFGAICAAHVIVPRVLLPVDFNDLNPLEKGNTPLMKRPGGLSFEECWRYDNSPLYMRQDGWHGRFPLSICLELYYLCMMRAYDSKI